MSLLGEDLQLRRLIRHAHQYFPEQCARQGEHGLTAQLKRFLGRAESMLLCEETLFKFVNLGLVYGEDFAQRPEMAGYLEDPLVDDANERVRRLYTAVLSNLRVEAESRRALEDFHAA